MPKTKEDLEDHIDELDNEVLQDQVDAFADIIKGEEDEGE